MQGKGWGKPLPREGGKRGLTGFWTEVLLNHLSPRGLVGFGLLEPLVCPNPWLSDSHEMQVSRKPGALESSIGSGGNGSGKDGHGGAGGR